ncbi:MAG: response regulator [Deltaproteobacteria bacterium]|nr:response regulator [Deltaproteobacteria bacterium]
MNKKPKILIVEDERIIALETRRKLESMGYDVSAIVSSGEEAIIKSEELHPDLVLMDIVLTGEMDGVEAAGQIHIRFGIPVVYVTTDVSDARLEHITRSEPFGCLFKPFEDMELQA